MLLFFDSVIKVNGCKKLFVFSRLFEDFIGDKLMSVHINNRGKEHQVSEKPGVFTSNCQILVD